VEGDVEVDEAGKAITNQYHVKLPQKRDMSVVVPIHNAVNERTWGKILEWESDRGGNSSVFPFFFPFMSN
jgi:cytochrome c heme-lyase